MKKVLTKFLSSILIAAMIVTTAVGFAGITEASAAADSVKVYVTIADEIGLKALKQKAVTVTDTDDDGVLTYIDALYCAHEKYFEGGAEKGFAYSLYDGYDIPFVTLMWGIDNGGNYFFYKNNASIAGAEDAMITDGDYVDAFVIRDTEYYSDAYSYFAKRQVSVAKNKTVKFKAYYLGYDENWVATPLPLANANIRINDKETDYVTDENGEVKISFDKAGSYAVTATDSYKLICDPLSIVYVKPDIGEVIKVKKINYTVTKAGKPDGKKGTVTYSAALNPKNTKKVPKKVNFGGITYKVKVVD